MQLDKRFAFMRAMIVLLGVSGLTVMLTTPVMSDSRVCAKAASYAAALVQVPEPILQAITRVETGLSSEQMRAWPWALNNGGTSRYFRSETELARASNSLIAQGKMSFDVGCFQLNYKWHHGAFHSVADMVSPDQNAIYAARFLRKLKIEFGNWGAAIAAYHSRDPELGEKYVRRVRDAMARPDSAAFLADREGSTGSQKTTGHWPHGLRDLAAIPHRPNGLGGVAIRLR